MKMNKCSRELGNEVIEEITSYIKQNISEQYVFVRYMGPKFVIAFSGVEINGVAEYINDLKEKIENIMDYTPLLEEYIERLNV